MHQGTPCAVSLVTNMLARDVCGRVAVREAVCAVCCSRRTYVHDALSSSITISDVLELPSVSLHRTMDTLYLLQCVTHARHARDRLKVLCYLSVC